MGIVRKIFGLGGSKTPYDLISDNSQKTVFIPRIDEEQQILAALQLVGAGFETRGGVSLMLTEAVENGVDSIIEARKNKNIFKKLVKVIIDKPNQRIIVLDDGYGFQNVKHVCEKPFKSLKAGNADYTGQFAKGLQGFRSFCNKLTFVTKRSVIPVKEIDYLKLNNELSGETVYIEYTGGSIKVSAHYVDDSQFTKYTDAPHGAIAIYEQWKPGEFEKLRKEDVIRRIEHHFGELIRQKEIKIMIQVEEGKIADLGPEQARDYECQPKEYSSYEKIDFPDVPCAVGNKKIGEIKFNLFLTDRGRPDRWNFPYLLYKKRPVGDGFIVELDEFRDDAVWESQFLTGYITCDFCDINSLRQALIPGPERDFLYKELKKISLQLERIIKKHAKGIMDIRFNQQINELVVDLQKFLKAEHIFDFKKAKNQGILTTEEKETEVVELVPTADNQPQTENTEDKSPVEGQTNQYAAVIQTNVESGLGGGAFQHQGDTGGHGDNPAGSKFGGPGEAAKEGGEDKGFKPGEGINKPTPSNDKTRNGSESSKRNVKQPRPRGFGIVQQANEFDDEPSSFDAVISAVVINSGHPRYSIRANYVGTRKMKSLLDYVAELYLWEICKLAYKNESAQKLGSNFLTLKFKYFEKDKPEPQEESEPVVTE